MKKKYFKINYKRKIKTIKKSNKSLDYGTKKIMK